MRAKSCKSCECRKRIYRQFGFGYYRDKKYYCTARKEMIGRGSGCDLWQRKIKGVDISRARFDEAEADIAYIVEYLKSQKENAAD